MKANPLVCRKQAGARVICEPKIHKASFIERRLYCFNHYRHREEGAFPDEAISAAVWRIAHLYCKTMALLLRFASGTTMTALAMRLSQGMV